MINVPEVHARVGNIRPSVFSRAWPQYPDRSGFRAGSTECNKEPVELVDKQPGSSARCGANLADALISAGIILEHLDGARTTDDIGAMAPRIDKESHRHRRRCRDQR